MPGLPLGMWQAVFVFAAVSSLFLTTSRKVLWAIPTLGAWIIVAYTSTNVTLLSQGTEYAYSSEAIGYLAVFMAAFTFVQLILYGLLPSEDPQEGSVEAPGEVVGGVSDQLEDSL